MVYLEIYNQPFEKCLTRISLPFVLVFPTHGWKQADSLRVRQGVGEETHTNPHYFCEGNAERCVCQTSVGSSEKAKYPPEEALHSL